MSPPSFTGSVADRVARALGEPAVAAVPVWRGYTPAARWRLTLRSGQTAFAKLATSAGTAENLRREWNVYRQLSAPCVPRVLGWDDDPADLLRPLLLLEDLGDARWPPPWDAPLVAEVRDALLDLHARRASLPAFAEVHDDVAGGWSRVAADPAPFLALGLVSPGWLDEALTPLLAAAAQLDCGGVEVLHLDVRSDNLCRTACGIVLVDWSCACLGNGALDLGFWLPSLEAEGGPPPETLLPDRPDVAAWVSGYFASRAGLPPIPDAPHVRTVQRRQLAPALAWVSRALGLPSPAP